MTPTKPIRILHVVGAMNRGGTETMLMNIYRKLDHEQIQFDFISYHQQEAHYDQEINKLGGRIIRLTKTSSIKQIYQKIKAHGPFAAIHSHTLFHAGLANIAAAIAGVPVRISHAHTTSDNEHGIYRKTYLQLMRFVIRKFSTHFLACSKAAGLYLFGKDVLNKQTYIYFPNVIDYQSFQVTSKTKVNQLKREIGLANDQLVIGHIGTFKTVKNHLFLLKMMKHMEKNHQIRMVLVGDGELKKEMQEQASIYEIEKQVYFLGIRDDIKTILHVIDVFVLPSIAEGLGLVLLEAQASGVPCLVSEAIQPEADIGLGLMTKLNLSEGPQAWASKIPKLAMKEQQPTSQMNAHFEKSGYKIDDGIKRLMDIYEVSRRDENETSTDYIL